MSASESTPPSPSRFKRSFVRCDSQIRMASFVPSLMLPAAESEREKVQGRHYQDSAAGGNLDSNEANLGANMDAKWRQDEQSRLNSARSARSATDSVHSGAKTVRRPSTAYSRMLHMKAPSRGSAGFEDYALQQRHETPIHADNSGKLLMTSEHEWAWGLADYDAGTNFQNNSQHVATGGSGGGGSRPQLALRRPSVCACACCKSVSLFVCACINSLTLSLSMHSLSLTLSLSLTHRVEYTSLRGPRPQPACTGW
jgi:hypothetical protein